MNAFRIWRRRRRLPWFYAQPPDPLSWCAGCKRYAEPHLQYNLVFDMSQALAGFKQAHEATQSFGWQVSKVATTVYSPDKLPSS